MNQAGLLWMVIELSATLFEVLLLLTLLSHAFGQRFSKNAIYAETAVVLTGIVHLLNTFPAPALLTVGIFFILSFIVSLTLYTSTVKSSLLLLLVYNILWGASEFGVLIVLNQVLGTPENFALPTMQRLIGLVSTKLVLFVLVRTLIRIRQHRSNRLSWPYFLALLAFPSASVLTIISLDLIWQNQTQLSAPVLPIAAASVIALFFANFLVFYLFDRLHADTEERARLQLLEQQIGLEKKNIALAERHHTELRRLAHDLDKMITPISVYLNQGKLDQVAASLAAIRQAIDENTSDVHSGNAFIDALLSDRLAIAERQGVQIRSQIELGGLDLPVPADDFCVLLGNAIDNAIEACAGLPTPFERLIHLVIRHEKGMLQLIVRNPLAGLPRAVDDGYVSSKPDIKAHGFGLESMRRIVKRHQGNMSVDASQNQFTLMVILPFQ